MARIAVDIQTLQTHERDRGIGRFIAGQTARLLIAAPAAGHTVIPVGNRELEPPAGLGAPPVLLPLGSPGSLPAPPAGRTLAAWAEKERIDLFYNTSPLAYDIALPAPSPAFARIAMVHDLIPLLFEDEAFAAAPAPVTNDYYRRLRRLSDCRRLLTYSESNRRDLERELGIPPRRVAVIGASVDPSFRPQPDATAVRVVREKYGVRGRLILSVTGFNFRKNLPGTIAAFARLPRHLRNSCRLLLACGFGSLDERAAVERLAAFHGVPGSVLLPGFVREDLPALYSAADCFFFPSRYEGFGLPVLEALNCGTPVVASNVSSIPEVVGSAGLLVSPDDPDECAAAIAQVLENDGLRAGLREKGLRRARDFGWAPVAERTLAAFDDALRTASGAAGRGKAAPVLCQVSPLPPLRSGIADYARVLGQHLRHWYRVRSGGGETCPAAEPGVRMLYHVGNSRHNYPAFSAALDRPGLVVLHDWSLHGMVHRCTAEEGNPQLYRELIARCSGEHGRAHAERVLEGRETIDFLAFPLSEELVRRSRGIVVHSRWMLERVSSVTGHAPVRLIPHGADGLEGSEEIADETAALGLPPGRFVVLSLGRLNRHKRIDVLLRTFQRLLDRRPGALLVLAGEMDDSARDSLPPLLERSGLGGSLRVLGYVPEERVGALLRAASVCVNLRFPTFGETSGGVFRALGVGRPVIVTDAGAFRELPDDCVWKIPVDARETDLLLACLEVLALRPEVRRQMGRNARRWIRANCLWERAAAAYASFIEDCYDSAVR